MRLAVASALVLLTLPVVTLSSAVGPAAASQTATPAASTAGNVTVYRGLSNPAQIATGPDGAMWFTNQGNNSIGRITTAGAVSNYSGPGIARPGQIAAM